MLSGKTLCRHEPLISLRLGISWRTDCGCRKYKEGKNYRYGIVGKMMERAQTPAMIHQSSSTGISANSSKFSVVVPC